MYLDRHKPSTGNQRQESVLSEPVHVRQAVHQAIACLTHELSNHTRSAVYMAVYMAVSMDCSFNDCFNGSFNRCLNGSLHSSIFKGS